jgi:hypothetical protein
MNNEQVQLAIHAPQSFLDILTNYARRLEGEATINISLVPLTEDESEDLRFDPVTGTVISWIAINIIAPTAISIGTGLITSVIYDELKAHQQQGEQSEITILLPSGEKINIQSNKPLDEQEVADIIRRNMLP